MAERDIHLSYRDDKSAKFWHATVDGATQTIRFGKLGTQGQTQTKDFANASAAVAATEKVAAEKRKKGYVDAGAPAPVTEARGGIFVTAGENVNANAIAAKLRGDGKLSKTDPRKLDGFGADGLVGVAVHPLTNGFWPVVDTADGAQGIGAGACSTLGVMANHLGTSALWYRVYSSNVALGVRFEQSSSNFVVQAGDADFVKQWLMSEGAPVAAAVPPKAASSEAILFTIKYEAVKYRPGPDEAAAGQLIALANLLIGGDGTALKAKYESLDDASRALALGILRGETRGQAERCILELAHAIAAAPIASRTRPKEPSFGEIVLQRAALLEPSDEKAAALITRLDEIERDGESRSDWAQTSGLWNLAAALGKSAKHARAHLAWAALVRRKDPHWIHVNMAVSSLLTGTVGKITLAGETNKTINLCERRMKALGAPAQDAILYNLACVYARAGEEAKALDRLARCTTVKEQNPHPEKDTDLEPLWNNPKFREIVGGKAPNPKLAKSVDDLEVSVRTAEALTEKGVKTLADVVQVKPRDFSPKIARELLGALEELDIAWGEDEGDWPEDDDNDDYEVPKDRAVPRLTIKLEKGGDKKALVNRIGGLPRAPSAETPWPESSERPMQLVAQLVGKRAGGELDLGDIHVLQIFADMEGDYYDVNEIVVHRAPCEAVLKAPAGCEVIPVETMKLTPGVDDAILASEDAFEHEAYEDASSHAWCDKIFGVPVGANLDADDVEDSNGEKMRLLLELTSYDDWFLWALFTNKDFSEFQLEVVRG